MKTFYIIGGVAVIIIIISILFLTFGQKQSASTTNTQNQTTLPSASSNTTTGNQMGTKTSGGTTSQSSTKLQIAANNGTTISVNDFIDNKATLKDPSNVGNYYLTGSSANGYAIGYRASGQFFTIALEKEPIGGTRLMAQNFLLSALGINESQLCSLNYYVGTDVNTNSFYAGKNLGFSFCPGATALPN